jgi:hypothetical protein
VVLDGPDTGRSTTANGNGEYRFDSLAISNANFRAFATGFSEDRRGTFVNGTNTLNFVLAPANAVLRGTVRGLGNRVADARIFVVDGPNRGRETRASSSGEYRLDGLSLGNTSVIAAATGFLDERREINITGDNTLDFELSPVPEPLTIVAFRVGGDPAEPSVEYGFEARGTGIPPSIYTWDFGDGGSVDNGRAQEAHVYTDEGDFLIRVVARPIGGGTPLTASLLVMVRF